MWPFPAPQPSALRTCLGILGSRARPSALAHGVSLPQVPRSVGSEMAGQPRREISVVLWLPWAFLLTFW